jgi:hypothetical protein
MRRLTLVICLLLATVTPVTAQYPSVRQGFWYGFGFGVGKGQVHCSICADQSGTDLTASLRAGGTLSKSWLLGGEFDFWTNSQDLVTRRSWSLSAVGLWYPWPAGGAYAKGGIGITGYHASDSVDVITASRLGLMLGVGYEWRIGKKYSLNPYFNYLYTLPGDLKFNEVVIADDARISSLQLGVGLVIH